jgi:hypothetical protein
MQQQHEVRRDFRWLRQVDVAILLVVAFSGIFLGLAEVVFKVSALKDRQVAIAIILLGALALHAILQRLTAYENRGELRTVRAKLDDLTSFDRARRSFIRGMAQFIDVQDLKFKLRDRDNAAFGYVADRLLAPSFEVLRSLADGHVNVPDNLVMTAFSLLSEACEKRLDLVSNDDINFWHDNETIAPRYLRQNMAAIRHEIVVTRVFIIVRRQLLDEHERKRLVTVLTYQRFVGIAWAIAILEDLEPSLPPGPLDFAVFDGDRAVSSFRREGERRFIATFNTFDLIPQNDERVKGQLKLYEALLAEVLLATEQFEKNFLGRSETLLSRLRTETGFYDQRLRDATGASVDHDVFPFVMKPNEDVADRVTALAELYRKYQSSKPRRAET